MENDSFHKQTSLSCNAKNDLWNSTQRVACRLAQLEIDDGDELTDEFLYDEVHPKQYEHKQAFAKPRGPAGKRGHKRLIKGPAEIIQDS